MIKINFNKVSEEYTGFECKGHSMSAPHGEDIVCAFVSSACFMTANTVTDVLGLDARAKATDGYMSLEIKNSPTPAQDILRGLVLHLTELPKDYPDNIKVTLTEV